MFYSTVNVYEANLPFVSDYFTFIYTYLNVMLDNFSFFLSMHKTKILILLVTIGSRC